MADVLALLESLKLFKQVVDYVKNHDKIIKYVKATKSFIDKKLSEQREKEFCEALFQKLDDLHKAIDSVKLHSNQIDYRANIIDPIEILTSAKNVDSSDDFNKKLDKYDPWDILLLLKSRIKNPPSIIGDLTTKNSSYDNYVLFLTNVRAVLMELFIFIGLKYDEKRIQSAEKIGNEIEVSLNFGLTRIKLLQGDWWPNEVKAMVANNSQYAAGKNLNGLFNDLKKRYPIYKWAVARSVDKPEMCRSSNVVTIYFGQFLGVFGGQTISIVRSDPLEQNYLKRIVEKYKQHDNYEVIAAVGGGLNSYVHPLKLPFFLNFHKEAHYDEDAFVEGIQRYFSHVIAEDRRYVAGGGTVDGTYILI